MLGGLGLMVDSSGKQHISVTTLIIALQNTHHMKKQLGLEGVVIFKPQTLTHRVQGAKHILLGGLGFMVDASDEQHISVSALTLAF